MQFYKIFSRKSLLTILGLSVLFPVAVSAVEMVDYTASSTFILNLTTGNPNQDFGHVYVESDSATGWVLKVRSTQGGNLQHNVQASDIAYTLTVDGIQVGSLSGGNDVTVKTTSTLTCPPPGGCSFSVQANISAAAIDGKASGTYSDTLIFTLTNQ